jgi:hypothetical protein
MAINVETLKGTVQSGFAKSHAERSRPKSWPAPRRAWCRSRTTSRCARRVTLPPLQEGWVTTPFCVRRRRAAWAGRFSRGSRRPAGRTRAARRSGRICRRRPPRRG